MCGCVRRARVAAMKILERATKALEDVKALRAQTSIRPTPSAAELSDHDEDVVERACRLGAPDPRLLLLEHEASAAAGQPLGGPHLTYSDDAIGVRYEATGNGNRHWRAQVSAFHALDRAVPFDAAAYWLGYVRDVVADDGVPVAGLGQEALQGHSTLYVLADPLLLMVEVTSPDGPDRRAMQALAGTVLGRLGVSR